MDDGRLVLMRAGSWRNHGVNVGRRLIKEGLIGKYNTAGWKTGGPKEGEE